MDEKEKELETETKETETETETEDNKEKETETKEDNQEEKQEETKTEEKTEEKKVEETEEYKNLAKELNDLKTEMRKEKVQNAVEKISRDLNITEKQQPYIKKLIKFEDMFKDGKVDVEKITEEIKGFADACGTKTTLGYQGKDNNKNKADAENNKEKSEEEKRIRRAFGLD